VIGPRDGITIHPCGARNQPDDAPDAFEILKRLPHALELCEGPPGSKLLASQSEARADGSACIRAHRGPCELRARARRLDQGPYAACGRARFHHRQLPGFDLGQFTVIDPGCARSIGPYPESPHPPQPHRHLVLEILSAELTFSPTYTAAWGRSRTRPGWPCDSRASPDDGVTARPRTTPPPAN
jgi:hypothetical protein